MATASIKPPSVRTSPTTARPKLQPPYHVILHDDNDHSYEYVVDMLCRLFRHDIAMSYQMAKEVDATGRVIVETTTLERAELKRDQIHAFGADVRIRHCKGSMSASIEPVE